MSSRKKDLTKVSAILDAMSSGVSRSLLKIAEQAGTSTASVLNIKKDYPLWEWVRLQAEDLRGRAGKNSDDE